MVTTNEARKRILVVDDEPAALVLLERRLSAEGYEIAAAEDGQMALAEIARQPPDLVILDVMMPRLSGFDVIRDLRTRPETSSLPVIAISAQGRSLKKSLADNEKPNAFFPKPLNFHELLGEISTLLHDGRPASTTTGSGGRGPGRLLAFIGAKGGVGTTTFATNVALCLARARWQTILLETASFHGTAAAALGATPVHRMDRLPLTTPEALDPAMVTETIVEHGSGLRILFGPSGTQAPPPAEGVIALIDALRSQARCVVMDIDDIVGVFGQVGLRLADRICVVTHPEPASLERADALIRTMEGWGIRSQSIQLVVNRSDPAMMLSPDEIAARTARPVTQELPPMATICYEAIARGRPLIDHPQAEAARRALIALTSGLVSSGRAAIAR